MIGILLIGMLLGAIIIWLLIDDYYENKMNDFYKECRAQYYIREAEKIKDKVEGEK